MIPHNEAYPEHQPYQSIKQMPHGGSGGWARLPDTGEYRGYVLP